MFADAKEYLLTLKIICWRWQISADATADAEARYIAKFQEYLLTQKNIYWREKIFTDAQDYLLTLHIICWQNNPTFQLQASYHAGRSLAGAHILTVAKLLRLKRAWAGPSTVVLLLYSNTSI